jgi:hypothetical protein
MGHDRIGRGGPGAGREGEHANEDRAAHQR